MSNEFDMELDVKHFHVIHVKTVLDGFDVKIPCEMCFEHLLTWKFHVKYTRGSGRAIRKKKYAREKGISEQIRAKKRKRDRQRERGRKRSKWTLDRLHLRRVQNFLYAYPDPL